MLTIGEASGILTKLSARTDGAKKETLVFEKNLEKTNHTVTIRVCEEKDEDSEGTYIRIGAFFGERE